MGAGKQVDMTSRQGRQLASCSRGVEEEEEEEEKGEGTGAGLAPLTTGPGLPSNP